MTRGLTAGTPWIDKAMCEPKAVPTFSLNLSKILGDVL